MNFTDLVVWKKAHQVVLSVYTMTKDFPKEEIYGLTTQMRRCATSIPANIAEGFKRLSNKEKLRFYNISLTSLAEFHCFLILPHDLEYSYTELLKKDLEEVAKLLNSLVKSTLSNTK